MPQYVEIGDSGQYVEFPDDMGVEDIRKHMLKAQEQGLFDGVSGRGADSSSVRASSGESAGDSGSSFLEKMAGGAEAFATVASSAAAEPISGLAGLVSFVSGGAEDGAQAVKDTREALTYSAKTRAAKDMLSSVGKAISPVAELFSETEKALGDSVYKTTGSPALAAMATATPTLALELASLGVARKGVKSAQKASERAVLESAAPSIDELKDTSRAIFKEIDDLGARVKPQAMQDLASQVQKAFERTGGDARITPGAAAVVDEFKKVAERGLPVKLDELDVLRTKAQTVARGIDPAQATPAIAMIDEVDSFLDTAGRAALEAPSGAKIGARYKAARELWGRARKSETIQKAFDLAEDQASGLENGLRTQFRSILRNKKQRRFFNDQEIDAMREVVRGTKASNAARLLGRAGFSEGQAHNFLGGAIGAAAGMAAGGVPGAVAVAGVGTVSRSLAQRLTRNSAKFADNIVRAGKNGERIVKAYMKNTPKRLRDPAELAELLMDPQIDLAKIKGSALAKDAADIAMRNRAALGATVAAGGNTDGNQI